MRARGDVEGGGICDGELDLSRGGGERREGRREEGGRVIGVEGRREEGGRVIGVEGRRE